MARTESQVNKQAKHKTFYNLSERISIPSSTLRRAERILSAFFPTRNTQKKRDILSKKRESGMTLKKREFTPESGTVDTYDRSICLRFVINILVAMENGHMMDPTMY